MAAAVVELVPPLVIRDIVDRHLTVGRSDGLLALALLYLLGIAAMQAMTFLYGYLAAAVAQRILHVPFKKGVGRVVGYLTRDELEAILAQPNRTTRKGRRDYLVLALLYDTGARVQELLDLCPADFRLDCCPLVRLTGKGRKQRIVPLLPATATLVRTHLEDTNRSPSDVERLFRNYRGEPLTRSGVTVDECASPLNVKTRFDAPS